MRLVTGRRSDNALKFGVPKGSRTPVAAVKGRSPRPLDDGDQQTLYVMIESIFCQYFFAVFNKVSTSLK